MKQSEKSAFFCEIRDLEKIGYKLTYKAGEECMIACKL